MPPHPANVDANEIHKFEALRRHWWDPNGRLKALHDINGLRLNYIDRCGGLRGKSVLDVGCGGGILAEAMAAAGARVTGIDMGTSPLLVARDHAAASGLDIDYRRTTVEGLADEPGAGPFDVITCMELLEHVPRPETVVLACGSLVRPGGRVVFATLNRNFKSFVFAIIGAEYVLRLVPRGTHDHRRFVRPQELDRWADAAGLVRRDRIGLHYNPILRRYSLGGNLDVNYMACYRRLDR